MSVTDLKVKFLKTVLPSGMQQHVVKTVQVIHMI